MTAATRAYLQSLPRKTVSAAALIRDAAGAVLLVKPTYKPGWEIPGGIVEADEPAPTPAAASSARSSASPPAPAACLPWRTAPAAPTSPTAWRSCSTAARWTPPAPATSRCRGLSAFRFVPPDEVAAHLAPFGAARIAAGLSAWDREATRYFDHGA